MTEIGGDRQHSSGVYSERVPAIDRLAPSGRPSQRAVMRQKWRDLLFVHWPIAPEALRPLVPPQLELDLFDGRAYAGLVAFTMTGVRPVGLPPVPGLSSFHETNVRTYVRLADRDPGVWFFNLEAASKIAVRLARWSFHLPYHYAHMFLEHEPTLRADEPNSIVYAGARHWPGPLPASYIIRARPDSPIQPAQPGSLEHFLVERYILFTVRKSRLYQGRVHHTPYPLQPARVLSLDETLLAANGIDRPDTPPLAHFARGVDVEVFPLIRS
ncbi:MAG TPA: DUF2071 domain-containing protein [Isosphaeraceae bacterium]|nr:DUF2071 domain-containing protein [Isosphaeraceae bacterium]